MSTLTDRVTAFHELHRSGCFVIPNPGTSAAPVVLARIGFKALATTSSGFAWSVGRRDNRVPLEQCLAHFRAVAAGVDVPVSADFEGGFAIDPASVAANVTAADDDRNRGAIDRRLHGRLRRIRSSTSPWPLNGSRPPAARSTRGRPASSSPRGPRATSSAARISRRRSGDSSPTPKPAPTASTHRESGPPMT